MNIAFEIFTGYLPDFMVMGPSIKYVHSDGGRIGQAKRVVQKSVTFEHMYFMEYPYV